MPERTPARDDVARATKTTAAVAAATLGGLASPSAADAMLPTPDGGGPPPDLKLEPPAKTKLATPKPAAKPVKRDPAPAPVTTPARDPQPQPQRTTTQGGHPTTRRADRPRQTQRVNTPAEPAAEPVRAPVRTQAEPPAPPAQVRSEAQRYANALDQIDRDDGAMRTGTSQAMQLGDDPRVVRRAKRIREREAPEKDWKPAAPAEPQPQPMRSEPLASQPQPQPQPQPKPEAKPQRAQGQALRSEAERYASALDHIDHDDGAMRMGTSQAMQLGDDPRVRAMAKQIRDREAAALEAQQERQRQRDRKAAEDTRVVRQGQAYMNAQDQIKDNGGALNMGLSRSLAYGDDPKVKAFVTEFERQMAERREDAREAREQAAVKRKAESYLNTLDEIERRDGALSMGLSNNLRLGDDPEVKKAADGIVAQREREAERERERERLRPDAERYLNALDQIDRNGGALNMGLSRTLSEYADNDKVRRLAEDLRTERKNDYKQKLFGPMDGPTLRDPHLGVAVPFPGDGDMAGISLEQKCMLEASPNAALACAQGPKKPPVSVELTSKLSGQVSRGQPELADNGKTYETVSVSVDLKAGIKGEAQLTRGVRATLQSYDGSTLTYKLRVTSERADQIEEGEVRPPNPIDPNSLRAGESITMDKEAYEGNSQSASYYALTGTLGFEKGRRLSSAVERLENGRMRILVGDEDFVRHAVELRLGTEDFGVAAGVSNEFATGDLRAVEVNPKREPGWDAYQHFVTSGELPTTEGPGIRDATAIEKASWSSSTTLKVNLKAVEFGGTSSPFAGDVTETRHSDGSTDYAMTDRQGGVTYIEQAKKELGDADYGPSEYSLLLQGVDSGYARNMTDLHGSSDSGIDGENQNLRIRFSEADLEQIRKDAIEQISYYTNQADDDEGMTPAEVEEESKKGYYDAQYEWDIPGGTHTTYLTGLATARYPGEVLRFLQSSSHGNSTALIDELMRFQMLRVDEGGRAEKDTTSPPGSVDVYAD